MTSRRIFLSAALALATVPFYPSGTSKWNDVEHRPFPPISLTWWNHAFLSYEPVVNLTARTGSPTAMKLKAILDTPDPKTGKRLPRAEFKALRVRPNFFHPDRNYTMMRPRDL